MPKSGEQEDQAAPREVAASMAMIDSGMLGTNPATRSPALTPAPFRALATRATSSYSCP